MVEDAAPTPVTNHSADGPVQSTGFLLDGEMHGDRAFFRKDGSVTRNGTFDRGRQVGTWRTFDRAGGLVEETVFRPDR
jgi:antitoxin component YwqK of YwqJK toxin-antitoxin module